MGVSGSSSSSAAGRTGEGLLVAVALDEGFCHLQANIVFELFGRRLEEVRGGPNYGTAQLAVEGDLGAAHGIDHHAGGVGTIPHFQLGLYIERHIAKGSALHADIAPLAVC